MFFTQEDYLKIENWLKAKAIKDSQFDIVDSINEITDYDYFVFLKKGENKRIKVSNLLSDIILQELGNATNKTISQNILTEKYNYIQEKISYEDNRINDLGNTRAFYRQSLSQNQINIISYLNQTHKEWTIENGYTQNLDLSNKEGGKIRGSYNILIGGDSKSEIYGNSNFLIGNSNRISTYCDYNYILGRNNSINNAQDNNILIGKGNITAGSWSFIIGFDNENRSYSHKYLFGTHLYTGDIAGEQWVLGKYNKGTDSIFIFGYGDTITSRKNLFEISREGKILINGLTSETELSPLQDYIKNIENSKQDKLTAGTGINISSDNTIICTLDTTIFVVVNSLPASPLDVNINKIHLVKDTTVEGNLYSEYLWVNNAWEKLGDFQPSIDLTEYAKTVDIPIEKGTGESSVVQKGGNNRASGHLAFAEGSGATASMYASHAEGSSEADGIYSHAEGDTTYAFGYGSHSEGLKTKANTKASHAEGDNTSATGIASHAEGVKTKTLKDAAHAEGAETSAEEWATHAEGYATRAVGYGSHTEGDHTIANNPYEHASGRFNKSETGNDSSKKTRYSIGIGTSETNRKNAVEVKQNGDTYSIGIGGYDGTNSQTEGIKTVQEVVEDVNTQIKTVDDKVVALESKTNFSYLEAITIYTDNTPEHRQANIDNIAAYEDNLQKLGVDASKGVMIPINADDKQGYIQYFDGLNFGSQETYFGVVCLSSEYFDNCYFIRIIKSPSSPEISGQVNISSKILQNEDNFGYLFTGMSIIDTLNTLWENYLNARFEKLTISGGSTPIEIRADKTYLSHKISFDAELSGPEDTSGGKTILSNIQNPIDDYDVANKKYVDDKYTALDSRTPVESGISFFRPWEFFREYSTNTADVQEYIEAGFLKINGQMTDVVGLFNYIRDNNLANKSVYFTSSSYGLPDKVIGGISISAVGYKLYFSTILRGVNQIDTAQLLAFEAYIENILGDGVPIISRSMMININLNSTITQISTNKSKITTLETRIAELENIISQITQTE